MSSEQVTVMLHIRRFDMSDDPVIVKKSIELEKDLDYNSLKATLKNVCGLSENDNKVIKMRNKDLALVPLSVILEQDVADTPFILDVSAISYRVNNSPNPLHDTYVDAIRKTIRNMESRVAQAEILIPQLQWRRQAHLDQTVNNMSSRVAFLNRRIDELMPPQWKSKMPQTAA